MKYKNIIKGKFLKRLNRFTAIAEINGQNETVHVKNTGRLKEILMEGAEIFLEKNDNPERKTKYDLVAARKNSMLINIDSQAPNKVFREFLEKDGLFSEVSLIKPETFYKNSRFDFYLEAEGRKIFVEVKGVTLEEQGIVRFPDAPTERGIKHINELVSAVKDGYEAYIVFVVQLESAEVFMPNDSTHKEFGDALRNAEKKGVKIKAFNCNVYENGFDISKEIKINLGG